MCEIAGFIIMILMSGIAAWDILYQKFQIKVLLLILTLMIVCRFLMGELHAGEMAAGALVGSLFLGVSKLTKEGLGYADSLLIMTLGVLLGVWKLLLALWIAFSLAGAFAMAGLALRKFSKKVTLPFLPFLSVSYAGVMLLYG